MGGIYNLLKYPVAAGLMFLLGAGLCQAQVLPLAPLSKDVFSPLLINPAIAGSKDFFSADIITGLQRDPASLLFTANGRLGRKLPSSGSTPQASEFRALGLGAALFHDGSPGYDNMGISAMLSYHISLNRESTSFLSLGLSLKGIYAGEHFPDGEGSPGEDPVGAGYYPGIDAGIYFYNASVYAGLSAVNIASDLAGRHIAGPGLPVAASQYYLMAGYKIILSRSLAMIIEPSLIVRLDDSLSFRVEDMLKPVLRLYVQDFCIGASYSDFDHLSFFLRYNYPRFYLGTFMEIARNVPYYKDDMKVELALGINLSYNKAGHRRYHW